MTKEEFVKRANNRIASVKMEIDYLTRLFNYLVDMKNDELSVIDDQGKKDNTDKGDWE